MAADITSTTTGGNWNATTTWTGGKIPVNGDQVFIEGPVTVNINSAVCTTLKIGTVNNSTQTITFNSGSILTVSGDVVLGSNGQRKGSIDMTNGGILKIGGSITVTNLGPFKAGTGTIEYNAVGNQTVTSNLGNYNNLTLSGSGTKTMTGVTVNGILSMQGTATATGTSPTYGISAILEYRGSAEQTTSNIEFPNSMATDIVINNNNGTGVTLNAAKTSTGSLTIASGSLNLNAFSHSFGNLTGSGIITNGNIGSCTLTVGSNGSSTTYSGVIQNGSGTVTFTKDGTGTLTLAGANSYSGITTIKAGIIKLGAAGDGVNSPLGTTANATNINTGAALDLNGFTLTTAETLTLRGTGISNGGALINSSPTDVDYKGLISLGSTSSIIANAGKMNITNTGTISGGLTLGLIFGGTGNGSILSVIGINSVTKIGTGTWTLSGANTYAGVTTIDAGILKLGAAGGATNTPLGTIGAGTTVTSGATLDLNGFTLLTQEPLILNGSGLTAAPAGALTNTAGNASYSGPITLGSASTITATASGPLTASGPISGVFALTLDGIAGSNGTMSGIISTPTAVIKNGPGTWTLSGANTYAGATSIDAGILKLGAAGGATNTPLGTTGAGTTVAAGATLDLNGFTLGTAESLTLNGSGTSNKGALLNSGATAIYNGLITLGSSCSIGTNSNLSINNGITGIHDLNKVGTGTLSLGSNAFELGSLTISEGSLTSTSGDLNVNGNFSNSGIFTPNNGTVILKGSGPQFISGTTTFKNLTISNSGEKTITGAVTVPGVITVDGALTVAAGGSLNNTGGSMVINSTATKAGSLIAYGSFTGTANTTFNRDMDNTRWYILSSPVDGKLSTFQSANAIGTTNGEYNLARYEEGGNAWHYYDASELAASGNFIPGQGYLAGFPTNGTKTYGKGALNNGDLASPVTTSLNHGWNAVGNPYASALKIKGPGGFIEMNKKTTAPANDVLSDAFAAIYVWNETGNYTDDGINYQYYKAIGNSGYLYAGMSEISQDYIQPGQGFLVNVKANGQVTFNNAMQSHQSYETLKSAEVSWPGVTLVAQSRGQRRSAVVAFNEKMTTGLDVSYDAGLLAADSFKVYSHLVGGGNEVNFDIQCLPEKYSGLSVPVGVDLPEGGELVFKVRGMILPQGLYPVIEDKELGMKTALKTEKDSYAVTLARNSRGTGRFYLSIEGVATWNPEVALQKKYTASLHDRRITINGTAEEGTKAQLFDLSGRKVGEYPLLKGSRNEIQITDSPQKVYLLRIDGGAYSQTLKLVSVAP